MKICGKSTFLYKILLCIVSVVVVLVSIEFYLQRFGQPVKTPIPICIRCGECSYLYQLNPEHPEVGPQGLRDKAYSTPKPEGVFRILLLGDSVVFGQGVKREKIFPELLEKHLNLSGSRYDVINAGVPGYSPFNEVNYYLEAGHLYQPDLVLIAGCLNDIVDPYLHWNRQFGYETEIPEEAIPNLKCYKKTHKKRVKRNIHPHPPEKYPLEIIRFLKSRSFKKRYPDIPDRGHLSVTGEVFFPIMTWLEDDAPEWQWFSGYYKSLSKSVQRSGSRFGVVFFPLEYQLEEGYPYIPQQRIGTFCRENNIPFLNMLDPLKRDMEESGFWHSYPFRDSWHLSERGHKIAAKELEKFIVMNFH
jgi:lysophospholipase L1-like esterase